MPENANLDPIQQIFAAVDLIVQANPGNRSHLIMPSLHAMLDAAIQGFLNSRTTACSKGCCKCCERSEIATFPAEALYIAKAAKLDKALIKRYVRDNESCCPMLNGNGECSIYQHRPLVCRAFHVPVKGQCNESYGAPMGLAVDMSRRTRGYQRLRLAPALLIAMESKVYANWLKRIGHATWGRAAFP